MSHGSWGDAVSRGYGKRRKVAWPILLPGPFRQHRRATRTTRATPGFVGRRGEGYCDDYIPTNEQGLAVCADAHVTEDPIAEGEGADGGVSNSPGALAVRRKRCLPLLSRNLSRNESSGSGGGGGAAAASLIDGAGNGESPERWVRRFTLIQCLYISNKWVCGRRCWWRSRSGDS